MDKIKFLAFMAVTAVFFACGSQDGSPPKLKNGGRINYISPFDTLVAEFDSKIVDIDKLNEENIKTSSNVLFLKDGQTSGNKLYFIGKHDSTLGKQYYFKPGVDDKIIFSDLKNDDGYRQKSDTLYYFTHRILDTPTNSTEATAGDIDLFGTVTDGVTFAGVLDHVVGQSELGTISDTEDYYTLKLKANDTITIKIESFREELKIQLTEPDKQSVNETFSVKKNNPNEFKYGVGYSHLTGDDVVGKMVPFYIKISDEKKDDPPNPYLVTINVKRN